MKKNQYWDQQRQQFEQMLPRSGSMEHVGCSNCVVDLYLFDEALCKLLLEYLFRVERRIRSLLSCSFIQKCGSDQLQYLNRSNFNDNPKHSKALDRLIKKLDSLSHSSCDYPCITYERKKHGDVPFWVLVNALPLGLLSEFFFLADHDVQAKVSASFPDLNECHLSTMLNVLAEYKSVCDHNERLVFYQTRNAIPDLPLHEKLRLSKKGGQYLCGKRDFFAVVIALRYLLSNDDFKAFKGGLVRIINKHLRQTATIVGLDLNVILGLPGNWVSITRYKK
jgi:abortive infection bacteriophage resistance protein